MCDTLIHASGKTLLFAKNSDRSPNEPNLYLFVPRTKQSLSEVNCTYKTIPQVDTTNAVFLVKPSWMYGAEMGVNEKGVVIGNEAVFSRAKKSKQPALLGMDLLRLALERASSAREAVSIIVDLLTAFGQGGNGGFDRHLAYDNSFLIQDDAQAFVLEILGSDWAVKEVFDKANISNRMALFEAADEGSLPSKKFPKSLSDPLFTHFSHSQERHSHIGEALKGLSTPSVEKIIDVMSSHESGTEKHLYRTGSGGSVCMHKSLLGDHTTASMIVYREDGVSTIWLSNGSTPCLSLYLPTYFGQTTTPVHSTEEDALAFWLTREYLRRAIYAGEVNQDAYLNERDRLQHMFLDGDERLRRQHASASMFAAFQAQCAAAERVWMESYVEAIKNVVNNPNRLPSPWNRLTTVLGKHVFSKDLNVRKQP